MRGSRVKNGGMGAFKKEKEEVPKRALQAMSAVSISVASVKV